MNRLLEFESLNNEELVVFLEKNGLDEFSDVIRAKAYDGSKLMKLSEFEMQLWRPKKSNQQMRKFWKFLVDLKANPEKYFAEEEEIYENYIEDQKNQSNIFKKNVTALCNNEDFINKLKTALQQKDQQDTISIDSFDTDDDELYENENAIQQEEPEGVYENKSFPIFQKRDKVNQQVHLPPKKPSIYPKPTMNLNHAPPEVCDKIEKALKSEIMERNKSSEKKNESALFRIQYRNPRENIAQTTELIDDYDDDDDEQMPEYLDIDKEEQEDNFKSRDLNQPVKNENIQIDLPKPNSKKNYDNIKSRPLPPLPEPQPCPKPKQQLEPLPKLKSIQAVPLPPVPNQFSSLPRPPNAIVDLGSISGIGMEGIEDFNFEQNFVSKYSMAKFYRYTDRNGSEQLLLRSSIKNGTFLVRPSMNHYCTLSVKHNDRVYQLALKKGQGTKVIQADVEYSSLEEYIEYYKTEPLCLPSKDGYVNVYLTDTLP